MNREQAQATFEKMDRRLQCTAHNYHRNHCISIPSVDYEDYYQAGAEALFHFLLKQDASKQPFFPTKSIEGAMFDAVVKAYPMRIPRNELNGFIKSGNAPHFCEADEAYSLGTDSPENEWLAEDSIAAVIQSLPELERMIVALHSEGLTYGEIADTLRPFISRDASAICRLFQRARRIALEELAR